MSRRYRDLVRAHSTAKRSGRAVLNILADYANDLGIAWPSVATIANDSGLSERSVIRALQDLLHDGHLTISEYGKGGRGRTTRYQIMLPETLTSCQGLDAVKGDKYDTERVTSTTQKGDKYDEFQSRARSEPNIEPNDEPRQAPPTKIPHVATNPLNGHAAIDFGNGMPRPNQAKRKADVLASDREKLGLTAQEFTALTEIVLDGMNASGIAELDNEFGNRELNDAQQCALALASLGHKTPDTIERLFSCWPTEDWRGKQGEKPGYRTLVDYAKNASNQVPAKKTVMILERMEGEDW